jgi:hypothetical protein
VKTESNMAESSMPPLCPKTAALPMMMMMSMLEQLASYT